MGIYDVLDAMWTKIWGATVYAKKYEIYSFRLSKKSVVKAQINMQCLVNDYIIIYSVKK